MKEDSADEEGDKSCEEGGQDGRKKKKTHFKCVLCSKECRSIATWKQHLKDHTKGYKCESCDKSFTRRETLVRHQANVHQTVKERRQKTACLTCETCNKQFSRRFNLNRHNVRVHGQTARKRHRAQFSCRHCGSEFEDYHSLFNHVTQSHPLNQEGGRRVPTLPTLNTNERINNDGDRPSAGVGSSADGSTASATGRYSPNKQSTDQVVDESALRNGVMNRYISPEGSERYDPLTFFGNVRDKVRLFLQSRVQELRGIKWNLCVQVEMQRDDGDSVLQSSPYFRSRTYVTLSADDVNQHHLNEAMQKMYASLEEFLRNGSGWYVNKVLKLEIHTVVYRPLRGSAYLPLPKSLAVSGSLLNIENQDDKCFLYCLLASLHPIEDRPECAENYNGFQNDVNMSGITYPVTLPQIQKVESQNENMSINVFTYDDNDIIPLRITEKHGRLHHVNLLWLMSEGSSHFCLITDLNRFLSRTNKHRSQMYFCHYCLHAFQKELALRDHQPYCSRHGAQKVELPESGRNDILEFKDVEKTLRVPFVIYCDTETINRKVQTCSPNPDISAISRTSVLEVCGFGYKVVCENEQYTKPTVVYRGQDAGRRLIECLLREEEEIRAIVSTVEPMDITEERDDFIQNANACCLCNKQFTLYDKTYGRIVRHHNHVTGEIIGPACNGCNLNCKQATFIPVIFHNLRNFDGHILCENLGHFKDHKLKCIAQNTEKYVSFSISGLRFIDSLQFLPASLEVLVGNLAQDGLQAFPHLQSETACQGDAELLLRKGVYPYEYMDSFEKFEEPELPAKEHFYSTVKKEDVSGEDYEHAQTVFRKFRMASLGEYHDLYLKTDVVLLSDVFESFRSLCLNQYELDPCHFYTSPGLSWSACLKMTGVKLELLTDIDKILMVEAGIRGGVSQISNRYEKANNPYLPDYDSSQQTTYLQYYDANNLYGWSMIQPLPVGGFEFMEERDIARFDVMSIPETGETGYILEVSLKYPQSLHDSHNCLPLAPERRPISNEELSCYAQKLLRRLSGLSDDQPLPNRGKVEKLLTTLEDKDRYVLHFRNLQLYLSLGMELKCIHRILKFKQQPWMKSYIEKNTEMRKKARSTFQKNFYKLLNVSVFGKTMENVRLHKDIELIHTEGRLRKVTAKPTYKCSTIFSEDLVAVELYKNKVNLNKPIYCGMCILDLSKHLMYDFWYNYIKRKYGSSARLQMTDTDSVLFSCTTEDVYKDMELALEYFDTSDYPDGHFLQCDTNKKALGKMKDETNGKPIAEFVGLRSKLYSFLCDGIEQKRAKGISRVTVKKELRHDSYKRTLFDETSTVSSMTALRSHRHQLFGETIQKIGLSAFDDKRHLLDSVRSYAYGHYRIASGLECASSNNGSVEEGEVSVIVTDDMPTQYETLNQLAFTIGDCKITPLQTCKKL